MVDKIEWHPNGTPGPWAFTGLECVHSQVKNTGHWVCQGPNVRSITRPADEEIAVNMVAIAEVPAMVQALRKVSRMIDFEGWAFSGDIRDILARIDGTLGS